MRKPMILATAFATTISVASAILASPATAGRPAHRHGMVVGRSSSAPMPIRTATAAPRATLSRYTQGLPHSAGLAAAKLTTAGGGAGTSIKMRRGLDANPNTPAVVQHWDGTFDTSGSPGDATGAVGPYSYLQVMNSRVALYQRNAQLVSAQSLGVFLGLDQSHCLVEPQVLWDPYTNAYYFTVLDLGATLAGGDCPVGQESLWYGWSKTKNPTTLSSGDWCALHYDDYGADNEIPDSPRFGDTKDFGLIGVNVFGPDTDPFLPYLRSDLVAFPKPDPGQTGTCPGSQSVFRMSNLSSEGDWDGDIDGAGIPAFAPVPVVQTDPSTDGYVVATDFNGSTAAPYYGFKPGGGPYLGNALAVFPVTKAGGEPQLGDPVVIPVTSYLWPRNAAQKGTVMRLDTQEGAPTQAMSGVDPVHPTPDSEAGAIWTQHVVRGGAGAMIAWYELDPTAAPGSRIVQSGTVSNVSTWMFNAAISSDRQVAADSTGAVTSANFGDSMVLGYDVSGTKAWVTVRMVSKIGDAQRSLSVVLKSSTGYNADHSCLVSPSGRRCRWGDYAGASPDPWHFATGRGNVWLANQWVTKSLNSQNPDWRSVIVRAAP